SGPPGRRTAVARSWDTGPAGAAENSPAFQRWTRGGYEIRLTPAGQLRFRLCLRHKFLFRVADDPALKRWVTIDGPIWGQDSEFQCLPPSKTRNTKKCSPGGHLHFERYPPSLALFDVALFSESLGLSRSAARQRSISKPRMGRQLVARGVSPWSGTRIKCRLH